MSLAPIFEVIVPFPVWRQALRPMLGDSERLASGPLRRDPGRQPTGLLADRLSAGPPCTGADYPPLADWIAVAAIRTELPSQPQAWLARLQPRFAQLLAIVLVGVDRSRGQWRGWTIERGVIQPLAGLRIVGPGMVHAGALPSTSPLDEPDAGRWSRLRGAVGASTFTKLREAAIAVVGCSRSGTLAAGLFASLGVRRLILIDGDQIEPHNLDGMILSAEADVGANKAIALGSRLVEYRSDLLVKAVPRGLNSYASETALDDADLVVTCVDRDAPRLRTAHSARDHLVPHLDIGAAVAATAAGERQLAADVRLLLPGAGCVCCVGGLADLEQAEYEFHAPPGALPRRPPDPWNARGRLGSLITLNSLAVSFGVQSWLDLLEGTLMGSIWHRLRWRAGNGLEVNSGLVGTSVGCRVCRPRAGNG